MNIKTQLATAALLLVMAGSAFAGTPRVDARQDRQAQRIEQGVASGTLTGPEAARLATRQQHIANAEARAKADGVVTVRERVRLQGKQNRASVAIARQKHDRQHRHW